MLYYGEKRRHGASARHDVARQNADDDKKQLPSSKLQRSFKGAASHINYQECLKEALTAVALKYKAAEQGSREPSVSVWQVVKDMQVALATNNIEISKST